MVVYDVNGTGGAHQEGTGIIVAGTTGAAGPSGGQGVLISGVTVEGTPVCVAADLVRDLTLIGCYLEPGETPPGGPGTEYPTYPAGSYPFGRARRRCLASDTAAERLHLVGTVTSEPNNPGTESSWTPTYAALAPETRTELQFNTFPASGNAFAVNGYGAALHGATAAYSNRIKNSDMSRGVWQWPTTNMGLGSQTVDPTFVIGGRSVRLQVGDNVGFYMSQSFVLDGGLRSVTVAVRYRLLSAAPNAFRFALYSGATRLGFFSDTDAGSITSQWKTRALTGRFDGLTGGVTGPRTLEVRIYPYNDAAFAAGQQVLVDSVWLVDGEYAVPYRPYTDGIEILRGDDRQILASGTFLGAQPAIALPFANVPSNAVGAILELRIFALLASTILTYLRIDDNEGGAAQQPRDLHAPANSRWALTDFLIPFTPNNPTPATWQVFGPAANNATTVGIRLKAWILRM